MTGTASRPTCLVLGGRGFVGSHVVETLLRSGWQVRIFGRRQSGKMVLEDLYGAPSGVKVYEGDFSNESDIEAALEGCTACVHAITTTLPKSSNEDVRYDVESNLVSTIKLLDIISGSDVSKLVFLSSGGTVYGDPVHIPIDEEHPTNPVSSYGVTKLAIEKYFNVYRKLRGLNYTVLRLSNPFGEGQRINASQGAVAVFLGKALRNETIEIWGDGSIVRDYVYVKDVAAAVEKALGYAGPHTIFNIGSGEGRSLLEIVSCIEEVLGRPIKVEHKAARNFDVPTSILNVQRAADELGWRPETSFQEGLARMAEWVRMEIRQRTDRISVAEVLPATRLSSAR